MKIIVDELPKTPSKCVFAEYDSGYMCCILSKETCELEMCNECGKLLEQEKG